MPTQSLGEVRRYLAAGQTGAGTRASGKASQARTRRRARAQLPTNRHVDAGEPSSGPLAGILPRRSAAIDRAAAVAAASASRNRVQWTKLRPNSQSEGERLADRGGRLSAAECRNARRPDRRELGRVLTAADALLAIAPQHVAAGQARRRAWKAVGMDVTQLHVAASPTRAGVAGGWTIGGPPVAGARRARRRAPVRSIPWQATNIRSERCCGSMRSAASWCASTTAIVHRPAVAGRTRSRCRSWPICRGVMP